MSGAEQGGALAGLRAAINRRISARLAVADCDVTQSVSAACMKAEHENDAAKQGLDAELTAAEARLGRLARFKLAMDAKEAAIADWADADTFNRAADELLAASAAITDEDVAGGGT